MRFYKIIISGVFMTLILMVSCSVKQSDLYSEMTKIDAHVHIRTTQPAVMEYAKAEGFKLLSICTRSASQDYIDEQMQLAKEVQERYPDRISIITTFSMENFGEPGWAGEVIRNLDEDFNEGAIGVKVWKDIGMTFRDSLGQFIFIDDPRFDPVFDFIIQNNKPVVAHIGEPKNCWMPIDSMTVNNNKNYYRAHPEYHMYLHPDYPSYDALIQSRDNLLARHPDLRLIGAHLGSLEWDVDELALRLDRYPNFAVDMSARMGSLQYQDREKVRDFIIRYQDRLLYGTDFGITADEDFEERKGSLERKWKGDWKYLATDETLESPNVDNSFVGLKLDEEVLRKIYYSNAVNWYPGIVH